MRLAILYVVVSIVSGFVAPIVVVSPPISRKIVRHGFLEDLMDKLEGKDKDKNDEWKEEMYRNQQEILNRRRKSGGFIDEAMEKEIQQRRESYAKEGAELKKIQQQAGSKDILSDWKKARDAGKFKTATKGLERDQKSSRFGSAGLFAERVDERLPYIDRGYVADKKEKKADEKSPPDDFFGNLKKMLGQS